MILSQKVRRRKVLLFSTWFGVLILSMGALLLFDNLYWAIPMGIGGGGVLRWNI